MSPFLKFAGGKTKLLPEILGRIPSKIDTYYEPFVGGGAVFFALAEGVAAGTRKIKRFVLSDANEELITTYTAVRDDIEEVIQTLGAAACMYNEDPENYYYKLRAKPTRGPTPEAVAARMILLNKTGYNGLYRVNRKGGFNVPWGKRDMYEPDVEGLQAASKALQGVSLEVRGYERSRWGAGSFGFFDPPYIPITATSFTKYTAEGFGPEDQAKLAGICQYIHTAGGRFLLSNADTPFARKLYKGFRIESVMAARAINSDGNGRGKVGELLVSGGGGR